MTSDQYNNISVITVEGDLTGPEAAAVRTAVERSPSAPNNRFVIDLERCRFVSGEGLEALLTALHSCEARGADLKLAGLDDNCRTILQVTRLDHRFDCCGDVAAALKLMA